MSLYRQVQPLWLPARLPSLHRLLGQLARVLAVLLAVPALFAAGAGDAALGWRLLLAGVLPALVLGLSVRRRPEDPPPRTNEALMVAALAFILAAALLTYPFMAAGLSLADAWFEAVSAVTTTGLSTVMQPETKSDAFLFARAWGQWFGGLGMVILSLALASGRVADMRRLAATTWEEEDPARSIRAHARGVLVVYVLLTLAGIGLAWACGLAPFQALIHILAAISTGGFGAFADSLASLGRPAQFAVLLVATLGALPLHLYLRAWYQGQAELWRDPELRALLVALLITAGLLWWLTALSPADALLQGLSAQTTTGFSTLDLAGLEPAGKLVLILSMALGGGVGSTAGGIKLLRLLIFIRLLQLALWRAQLPPHAVAAPMLGGRTLETAQIEHALVLILLYVLLILVSWLPFLAIGYPPLDALFEVVSATATVGLSAGITGPDLETGLKLVLGLDMLAGRVEILAMVVLLYAGSWHKGQGR